MRDADRVMSGVLVAVCVLLATVFVSGLLGYRLLVVESGSMVPTMRVGDLVVSQTVSPMSARPGEIVTFRDVLRHNVLVTHRVVRVVPDGPVVHFKTKGDANRAPEYWSVPKRGTIGHEIAILPGLGRILSVLTAPAARTAFTLFLALWIAFIGMRWIWRRPTPIAT